MMSVLVFDFYSDKPQVISAAENWISISLEFSILNRNSRSSREWTIQELIHILFIQHSSFRTVRNQSISEHIDGSY
jgi:hypothetical protein